MKNRWKHIFIPVLAMALCLSLAACGNSDDVAGDDWRTTGVVVGSGTITHDGESVDVLSLTVTSTSTLSPSWVMVPLPTTMPVVRQSSPATLSELPQAARLRQSAMASTGIKICFHRFFMVLLPFHHSIR